MKAFIFIFLFFPGLAHTAIYDLGDASGLQPDPAGNFYKTNTAGTVSATKSGSTLSLLEKVQIPTSKGTFAADLARSVPVDISRVGKAMRILAVASGPVGLAVTTVDAICTLTSICNEAGQWNYVVPGGFNFGSVMPSLMVHDSLACSGYTLQSVIDCAFSKFADGRVYKSLSYDGSLVNRVVLRGQLLPNFPDMYMGKIYTTDSSTIPYASGSNLAATSSDWDSKQSLLNDAQFIQPLLDKNQPVPVGAPSISTPQKIQIGSETKTTKDGSGNTTGTETTTTEAEISQPSGAENPTNSPSVIKIIENNTTNTYNTNNQLVSSVSTVTSNSSPVQTQQQPITITIDNVPDVPLQTVAVPGTFSFTSWGSGSCPAPKTWVTMFGTHEFSYQLTCDFATTAKPIILLIAGIVSFMIVASIRTD